MRKKLFTILLCLFWFYSSLSWAKTPKLLEHAWGDTKETFTLGPLLVLAGGAAAAGIVSTADGSVRNSFRGNSRMGNTNSVFDVMGAPTTIDSAAALTFGIGALSRDEEILRTGETLAEALVFSETATLGLKIAVDRKRPNGGRYSFPSGHTSRTFAVATVLETLHGPYVGIPSYLLASLISFSRIDANAHNLSDVAFGAALGSAIGWGAAKFHKETNHPLLVWPFFNHGSGIMALSYF